MVTKKARKILPNISCQNFIIEKSYFSFHLILENAPLELLIYLFFLRACEWIVYFLLPEAVDKSPIPEVDDN